ncbi:MAG: VCBS repeat-containing protein [Phycisphaerales bacterium]
MPTAYQTASICTAFMLAAGAFAGDWVQFTNETADRLVAVPGLGVNDTEEKDYAWGDVDQDGDIDLVVVRKQIGSTTGRRRNVLFMNEDGVLTDRTDDYAVAADDGGQGFLDLTNDRDVALVDVDGDGWLDIVTVTTYGAGLPKTISHPRIYLNLQEERGVWQGFEYQEARFPQLVQTPSFCGVGFGDVTGDDAPDLFFNDYLNTLENRILINNGSGFFTDETTQRFAGNLGFLSATFSVHSVITDLNHDGFNDIVSDMALGPYQTDIAYNDPGMEGFFTNANTETATGGTPYFVAVDDLNNDGLLDVVAADDGADRYLLNQGNGGDGKVNWLTFTFPDDGAGFDNNTVIADLDNDGFKDVLIGDVDADLPSCSNRLDIYRNLANPPNVSFDEDVGNLPTNNGGPLRGTHDIAVFDIDGDCWLDLVIGVCNGTTVWINQGEGNICSSCTADLDGDGSVGAADLLTLLAAWGPNPGHAADFDGDGNVGASDLLVLLANWGTCPD